MEGWEHPASELDTCIGQLQCPTCDTVVSGALQSSCAFCEQPLFPNIKEAIKKLEEIKGKAPEEIALILNLLKIYE